MKTDPGKKFYILELSVAGDIGKRPITHFYEKCLGDVRDICVWIVC